MKRIVLTIAAAAWVAVSVSACRPSHAPTFKDLDALPDPESAQFQEPENIRKLRELYRAMKFTPAELRKIRGSGDVRLLVGAFTVTDADNPLAPELLRLALSKAPDDPAPLTALAYRATQFQDKKVIAEPEFLNALNRWRKLEPENSAPYYFEMAWLAEGEEFDEAARALAEASRHPKYDSHCAALRLDAVAAGDFVGYPKFTARYLAFSFLSPEMRVAWAGRRCLNREGANEQVARDCIVLGKRLEAERTLLIDELAGLSLQSAAMKKFPQTGSEAELKRIGDRGKRIGEIHKGMRDLDLSHRVSEKRSVALLDEVFSESEAAADEKLIAEYGGSSK